MSMALSSGVAVALHQVFEWGGIAIGFQLYRLQRRRAGAAGVLQAGSYAVVLGCILGAAIGNKLVFWIEMPHVWNGAAVAASLLLTGQSIVGGLLGGLIGVEIGKKLAGTSASTGDLFVLPLMVGTAIGRVGCFLAGLNDGTFGVATALPWGIDFGDGVARHPTQLYEIAFVLAWGGLLLSQRARWAGKPGLLFKFYLSGYLAWRFVVDAIKPVPYDYGAGLSGIQWVCLIALACYLPLVVRQALARRARPLSFP
jgi:phosphatidylglycerol:prolipoprotein diacylglycerol transferase